MKQMAPLTQSQFGVFAECMQNPESDLYQLSYLLTLGKDIDLERLKTAIIKAMEAHPYANCRVRINGDGVAEQYIEAQDFDIQIETIDDLEAEKPRLFKKMALDGSQLLYFKLLSAPEANYLYFQFHHIIFDGASLRILLRDIDSVYQGKAVDLEPISSINFALKEFELRQGELWQNDKKWYQEHYVCDDVDTLLQPDLDTEDRKHSLYSYADFCTEQGVETHQMFVYQGKLFRDLKLDNKSVTIEQLADNTTNQPLEIQIFQTNEGYTAILSHHANLYSDAFIEQLIQSFETVIGQMMDLDKPIKEIHVISEEQQRLLDSFNDTDSDYDDSQTIVSLFKKQVELWPSA